MLKSAHDVELRRRRAWHRNAVGVAVGLMLLGLPANAQDAARPAPADPLANIERFLQDSGATDLARRAFDLALDRIDQGLARSDAALDTAAMYTSRAVVEFLNVLGMNEMQPLAPGQTRTAPEIPSLAMPPEGPVPVPAEPQAASVSPSTAAPGIDPAEVRRIAEPAAPPAAVPTARLGEGFVNDTPHKLPDGTLFVPKAAQRLYALRTAAAGMSATPVTAKLDGVVIPDPSRGGQVQANFNGRVEPTDGGMPFLGMRVQRGQTLAYLRSALTPAERANMRNEIARLTTEIFVSEKKIERMGVFFFVPFREGKIVYEKLHLEGMKRQRDSMLTMLVEREPIRASASGVISAVNAIAGQIVETRQAIFEIVDPDGLWIQAIAYDPAIVSDIAAASALTTDGLVVPLHFMGSGLELKQQAIPLHFRLEGSIPNLMAGKPVSVIIQASRTQPGIVLPNDSIVRTGAGQDIVWEKVGPEQFVARTVSTRPLDATKLYVVAGLDPETTIVTSSARLLSQFR